MYGAALKGETAYSNKLDEEVAAAGITLRGLNERNA